MKLRLFALMVKCLVALVFDCSPNTSKHIYGSEALQSYVINQNVIIYVKMAAAEILK